MRISSRKHFINYKRQHFKAHILTYINNQNTNGDKKAVWHHGLFSFFKIAYVCKYIRSLSDYRNVPKNLHILYHYNM